MANRMGNWHELFMQPAQKCQCSFVHAQCEMRLFNTTGTHHTKALLALHLQLIT